MRNPLRILPALALLFAPNGLFAQTTPTERQAAKPVIDAIDRLQAELAPARVANAQATKADPARDRLLSRVESQWKGGLESLSDWIGRNPEVGFKEFKAVDTTYKDEIGR